MGDDDFAEKEKGVGGREVPWGCTGSDDVAKMIIVDVDHLVIFNGCLTTSSKRVGGLDLILEFTSQMALLGLDPGGLLDMLGFSFMIQQLPNDTLVAEEYVEKCFGTDLESPLHGCLVHACRCIDDRLSR